MTIAKDKRHPQFIFSLVLAFMFQSTILYQRKKLKYGHHHIILPLRGNTKLTNKILLRYLLQVCV